MRAIEGMIPPDGWHFKQGSDVIRSDSYKGILQAILEYRISNNVDIGNVQEEFLEWFCREYPRNCQFSEGARRMKGPANASHVNPVPAKRPVTKVDQINRILAELSRKVKPQDVVLEGEANVRAQICVGCPFNEPRPKSCASCATNVERTAAMIRNNRDHMLHAKLNICAKTNLDTRTAIWVRKDLLPKSDEAPSHCWNK